MVQVEVLHLAIDLSSASYKKIMEDDVLVDIALDGGTRILELG